LPKIPGEIRRLIREMSLANRLWGAPRIHGELLKLGIEVAQSTVAKYMARSGRGRSQTWKTFLQNHSAGIGAMDFLIVPATARRSRSVLQPWAYAITRRPGGHLGRTGMRRD
jgi:hypothetical protein